MKHYGFKCECPACQPSEFNTFASDSHLRRWRLREINEQNILGHIKFPLNPKKLSAMYDVHLVLAFEAAGLLIQEGLENVELGLLYVLRRKRS